MHDLFGTPRDFARAKPCWCLQVQARSASIVYASWSWHAALQAGIDPLSSNIVAWTATHTQTAGRNAFREKWAPRASRRMRSARVTRLARITLQRRRGIVADAGSCSCNADVSIVWGLRFPGKKCTADSMGTTHAHSVLSKRFSVGILQRSKEQEIIVGSADQIAVQTDDATCSRNSISAHGLWLRKRAVIRNIERSVPDKNCALPVHLR